MLKSTYAQFIFMLAGADADQIRSIIDEMLHDIVVVSAAGDGLAGRQR